MQFRAIICRTNSEDRLIFQRVRFMKYAVLFLLLVFFAAILAQEPISKPKPVKKVTAVKTQPKASPSKKTSAAKPKPKAASTTNAVAAKPRSNVAPPKKTTAVKPKPTPTPITEKEQFEKASAHELAADRVAALEAFLKAFPRSENRAAAVVLVASSRVLIAEEKMLSGDTADAAALLRRVVEDAPQPIPTDLFNESIARIPSTLFFRGQHSAAIELASLIESKVENNAAQLLEIANFHLSTENGAEAMRVAAKAAAKDPTSAAVHRTLALAHRINFDLELSADSYAKALELEPDSLASKRGLAEMKRALGKSDEAIALYRELLTKNESDVPSRTGLVLSLFDAGKQTEAEAELARSLEQTPGNIILQAGAAYWYASKGLGDKAVELAQKAIAREPRYVWSHIALARGLMIQHKPVDAEQALIKARAYGNFPTLEYELASARMAAGFFREAVEDLSKQFVVAGNGRVKTNLGGRVAREEKNLADLVSFERKASIFTPAAADTAENAEGLQTLLILDQKLRAAEPNEGEIAVAVEAFTQGTDKMKLYRQIHAASLLLEKRVAPGKVLELAKAATGNTDTALEAASPRSAVMASELYEARAAAFRRNDFLLIPDVPKQTLSAILRGRIEDMAGWALYQQNNFPDAIVRLRRAISVMPDKSAWWRLSMWRLGAALAADGRDVEALNSYIESYKTDKPDLAKFAVVEALYKKVNGTTDGLEAKIGRDRAAVTPAIQETQAAPTPIQSTEAPAVSSATPVPSNDASPSTQVVAEPAADPSKSIETRSEPDTKKELTSAEKIPATKIETPVRSEPSPADAVKPEAKEVSLKPADANTKTPDEVKRVEADATTDKTTNKIASSEDQSQPAEKPAVSDPKNKPLFEPIIITIPSRRPAKPDVTGASKIAAGEKKQLAEKKSTDADKKSDDPSVNSGSARPRLIDGQEVKLDEPPACVVGVSQENVSLINNGGSVGILVSVEAPGEIKDLAAISSSLKDIEVTLEPEISGVPDKRFYVIKSVSAAVGVYQVTFAAPCGKKNIIVTVR